MSLGLISCTKSKRTVKCKAREMYVPSQLFRAAFAYAKEKYDIVAIPSAKYGLLLPDDEIEPYELTLKTLNAQQRKKWAEKVMNQIKERIGLSNIRECFFHAGKEYRQFLVPFLEKSEVRCNIPLQGLSIGKQIQWYKQHLNR